MRIYLILFYVFFIAVNSIAQPKVVDKIIAQVGDNIILYSDIENQKLQATQAGITADRNLECNVLEQLMC
jgi:peptidyl-prolyl cis-trans isomerase SurA